MTDWTYLYFFDKETDERTMVAKFDNEGKLLEYNSGHLWRFSSELLALTVNKVLKAMKHTSGE